MNATNDIDTDDSIERPEEPPEDVRWRGENNETGVIEVEFDRAAIEWLELEAEPSPHAISGWIKSATWGALRRSLEARGPTRRPEVDLPEGFVLRCRLMHEIGQKRGDDASLDEIIYNHMRLRPEWTIDGKPLWENREADDEPELATDGGTDIDWPDDISEETRERLRQGLEYDGSIKVHADVEVPSEVWQFAQDRVDAELSAGLTSHLLDYLDHEYRFTVDGEEVHRTGGFDPELVTDDGVDDTVLEVSQRIDEALNSAQGERVDIIDVAMEAARYVDEPARGDIERHLEQAQEHAQEGQHDRVERHLRNAYGALPTDG